MKRSVFFLLLLLAAAGCASTEPEMTLGRYSMTASQANNLTTNAGAPAPLDPTRTISDRDCSGPIDVESNLRCR
ncbi:MAG TPA: hypothetical protein VE935_22165 [Burkholderiales bacterium]|jgi:hypothetical protein|nr:hypothetical protein [Burkholderiales bacterium]